MIRMRRHDESMETPVLDERTVNIYCADWNGGEYACLFIPSLFTENYHSILILRFMGNVKRENKTRG